MNSEQFFQWCRSSKPSVVQPSILHPKPLIMGILNITPDSFSDGGTFIDKTLALQRTQEMIAQGADIIDIGGESTRPGATPISIQEELSRIIPVIEAIRATSDICISIDTHKAEVMSGAVASGATFINDIQALRGPQALETAAGLNVPICLMHMKGTPASMQKAPHYEIDVVLEINRFFEERIHACLNAGIPLTHLILDPGFGFGKTVSQNLRIVRQLNEFLIHGLPLLLGVSRKSTLGVVLDKAVDERLLGGIATATYAVLQGVSMIRTHDVEETKQALKMIDAITQAI